MKSLQTFDLESLVQLLNNQFVEPRARVSPEESRANLIRNVVGIYNLREINSEEAEIASEGCGLRLTTDGYVLTAYHVVEQAYRKLMGAADGPDYLGIIDQNSEKYYLDPSFIVVHPEFDLAIVKQFLPLKGKPLRFNININPIYPAQPLSVVAFNHETEGATISNGLVSARLENHPIYDRDGISIRSYIPDFFHTTAAAKRGNSGGIFITKEGSLKGTLNFASFPQEDNSGFACGIDIVYGMRLIATVASLQNLDQLKTH